MAKTQQIKITLTKENYDKLKESAEKNYRTLSQEVNYRLHQLLSRPGGLDSLSAPSPIYFPPGVRTPVAPIHTMPTTENPDRETNRNL